MERTEASLVGLVALKAKSDNRAALHESARQSVNDAASQKVQ
jgi:hypothetical protein